MANFTTCDYSSDDDLICEEQIQYTYLNEEIEPMGEIVMEENANQNFGIIDIEEYERVRNQAEELDDRNWELKFKCRTYELQLRILKRSISTRIWDRVHYWKEVTTYVKQRTNSWIKWMCRQSTEGDLIYLAFPRYQDMLEARYYPHDLNLE